MKDIKGTAKICGVIGNPIEHTLSPFIHNTLAEKTGLDLAYVPFLVKPDKEGEQDGGNAADEVLKLREESLGKAIEGAYALGLLGLNITVPYKRTVMNFVKETDPIAKKVGAVNTLVRIDGGYKGYNTDVAGLGRALESDNIPMEGDDILVLGAGGAARAVGFLMLEKGAASVTFLNRSSNKAENLAFELNSAAGRQFARALALPDFRRIPEGKRFVTIQATSVGLGADADRAVIEDPEFYKRVGIAVDVIFNPAETKFMKLAKQEGAKTFNGLKMLLYQGIIAFELWTGKKIDEATADEIYLKLKEQV